MTPMRMSTLLILLFLIFSTASANGKAVGKPKEGAPQTAKTVECTPASVSPPQAESKPSTSEVLEVAHMAVDNAESYIHYVAFIGAILALFLTYVGVTNIIDARRNKDEMMRLEGELRKLEDSRKYFEQELKKLEDGKKGIEDDLEKDKRAIKAAREEDTKAIEAAREEFRYQREEIIKDMAGLKEQQKSLWESSEAVRGDLAELKEQEKSLRKLTETVQKVTLGRSRLSAETRLKALQHLSQPGRSLGNPSAARSLDRQRQRSQTPPRSRLRAWPVQRERCFQRVLPGNLFGISRSPLGPEDSEGASAGGD